MATRPFSDEALQAYLDEKDTVVLATITARGSPLAMPMWFVHDRERIAMISVDGLAKVRNLERRPEVCIVAEGGARGAASGLVLTGTVQFFAGPDRARWGGLFAAKYHPHLDRTWVGGTLPANRRVFAVRPRVSAAWGF